MEGPNEGFILLIAQDAFSSKDIRSIALLNGCLTCIVWAATCCYGLFSLALSLPLSVEAFMCCLL